MGANPPFLDLKPFVTWSGLDSVGSSQSLFGPQSLVGQKPNYILVVGISMKWDEWPFMPYYVSPWPSTRSHIY